MSKFIKTIATVMLMMAFAASCTKPDELNNGGNNNGQNDTIMDNDSLLNGYDYVDLGLPSGTLWATCNVGANSPEDIGYYFASAVGMRTGIVTMAIVLLSALK